jgi:alpha-L-fucosidase 2
LPDPALQRHYDMARYFYGAASRRGSPPIQLQGIWTADEGKLPPWKGEYANNLNTQVTYWPYLAADHLEEGLCLLDFLWNLLPRARQFAKAFYGAPGACLCGAMAVDGQPLGGWAPAAMTPTHSAWLAHAFYRHWRYTLDRQFLSDRAYPWCAEVGECIAALLKEGPDGKLKLPLSASPEFHDGRLQAWMKPPTTYDLALMRWLFGALAEMAGEMNDAAAAARWRQVLDRLEGFAIVEAGNGVHSQALMLSPGERLTESHRHFSHLMASIP